MLVQICCSVDSHYFLKRLRKDYPNEEIVGYFYNPNIHPLSEYETRYIDVKRSCEMLNIKLIKGEWEYDKWYKMTKKFALEPERGKRCLKCFDIRILKTALMAKKLGKKTITTTLLMSPKKSISDLASSLEFISKKFNLNFIAPDFRKNGGSNEQFELARVDKLYHQNYCGCFYANDKELLFEDINGAKLPNSSAQRYEIFSLIYNKFIKKEEFDIKKEKILNYRLLWGKVSCNDSVIDSFVLYNSHFKKEINKFEIKEFVDEFYTNKDEINLISLDKFNKINNSDFKNLKELKKNFSLNDQINFRFKFCGAFSLSPIIILNDKFKGKFLIQMKSEIFLDTIYKVL